MAALEAVAQVFGGQQGSGRDHHGAELERGQHAFPQRELVAEHQQDAVAAPHAASAQEVGDLGRALDHLRKVRFCSLPSSLTIHSAGCSLPSRHRVEVVERPVEAVQHRPAEVAHRADLVAAMGEQEVARGQKSGAGGVR